MDRAHHGFLGAGGGADGAAWHSYFGSVAPDHAVLWLRLLLGIAEAGFFPGVIVYLSHWYRPEDRSRAKAYFMVTQPLAVALGIPLSRWILENVHWSGLAGWRWVFILEGIAPLIMGFVTLWYLTDRPQDAHWLPTTRKEWLLGELKAEEARKTSDGRVSVLDALRYSQTFLLIAVFFLIVTGNQALIFFLPSITDSMKGMPVTVRTLAAGLPYMCSAVGILINGMWAHRTGALRWHTAVPILATRHLARSHGAGGRQSLVEDGPVLPRGFHLAGIPRAVLHAAYHAAGEISGRHDGWIDLPRQPRRLRGAVAVRSLERCHGTLRRGLVGISGMHAGGGIARHVDSQCQKTGSGY